MDVISTHINADFDCLGSMIAALKLYPEARLIFSGSQEKNVRDYLHQVKTHLPFIKLKSIDWQEVKRLILVDTRSLSRLGEIGPLIDPERIEVHIYDHHPSSADDVHGTFEVIADVGATTTLFTEIIRERGYELTPEEATIMALAIYEDTGNFIFRSTCPRDLAAASYLIEQGADLDLIAQYTRRDITPDHVRMLNELINGMEKLMVNGQEMTIISASTEEYFSDLAVLAHKLDAMYNLPVLFIVVRMGDRMSLIARSRVAQVDVSYYAKAFGGGGHPSAASASIKDLTLIEARNKLISLLHEHITPQLTAADIMSAPVWTVHADDTLEHTAVLMNHYSINNMPVEENDYLIGIISRQIVDKAIFHKLAHHLVRDYMSTDVFHVDYEAPAMTAQNIMIENNLRFIPVVQGKKVVGVVTRTDILRRIYDEDVPQHDSNPAVSEAKTRKNIYSLIRERTADEIFQLLQKIGEIGDMCAIPVYVVGGFVRDLFLRVDNIDFDIVIEGNIDDFARKLASALQGRVILHKKFETAVIICPDGFKFDIATARTEYYPKPAALPTIEVSSIKQDLYRRDFTINTLAVSLNSRSFGLLLDFFGSQKDIKDKTIRVLHGLSFIEDPSRVFRAIRFESRFDFSIGKQTLHFIQTAVSHGLIGDLSGKRMMSELRLMLQEYDPGKCLARMDELKVLQLILPGIDLARIRPLFKQVQEVLLWYNYLYSDAPLANWMVYFLALLNYHTIGELKDIMQRLEIPKQLRTLMEKTKSAERSVLSSLENRDQPLPSSVFRVLNPYPLETIMFFMAKTEASAVKRHISNFITFLRWQKCFIAGKDLIRLGIPQGPLYQEIISHILDLQLDGIIHSKEDALALVREKYLSSPKYRT